MAGPDSEERGALLHFLAAGRRAALLVVDGLSETDAHRSVVPSAWSPFDLLVRLGGVERHCLRTLTGDREDAPARSGPVTTLAEAVDAYRAECERSDRILAGLDLDDPLALPPDELVGEVTTVRGVLLHVVEEVARHAGHLDVARELLDGPLHHQPRVVLVRRRCVVAPAAWSRGEGRRPVDLAAGAAGCVRRSRAPIREPASSTMSRASRCSVVRMSVSCRTGGVARQLWERHPPPAAGACRWAGVTSSQPVWVRTEVSRPCTCAPADTLQAWHCRGPS